MIRYASCVWELPMPTTFRAYQPDQPLLLPPTCRSGFPQGTWLITSAMWSMHWT